MPTTEPVENREGGVVEAGTDTGTAPTSAQTSAASPKRTSCLSGRSPPPSVSVVHWSPTQKGDPRFSGQERPAPCLTSTREGSRHRSGHGCMRIRHRPENGGRVQALDYGWWKTGADRPEARRSDLRRGHPLIEQELPDAVALEESFVGVDARTALSVGQARGAVLVGGRARRSRVLVRADPRQAGGVRLRPGREGPGAADGAGDPPSRSAHPGLRRRRSRRRHLPRAGTAAAEGSLRVIARLTGTPVARTLDGLVLDVGGIGYLLRPSARALQKTEAERRVARHVSACPGRRAPALCVRRAGRARAVRASAVGLRSGPRLRS